MDYLNIWNCTDVIAEKLITCTKLFEGRNSLGFQTV